MSNKLTLRDALQLAIRQNEHDMVLTGEELRACNAALASQAEAEKQCATCGFIGQEDPVKGCPKCGFDDMRAKAEEHRDGRLAALEEVAALKLALTAMLNDPAVIEVAQPGDIGRALCAVRGI